MYAVVTRVPGGHWRLIAGPFPRVGEAREVALRVLRDTPPGEGIVGTCPWDAALDERRNVAGARESGAIERVTGQVPRAVWIDEGNDPDYARLAAHGITEPYFSIRDPRVTKPYLRAVRDRPGITAVGIYAAWNWYPQLGGAAFAAKVSAELERIAPKSAPDFPKVQLNAETHDVRYLIAMLEEWRRRRQKRVTSWTLEGYQGGLFSPVDAIAIAATGVEVVPQSYTGSMVAFDAVDVYRNLVLHSFPPARVSIFYDAAQLPAAWSGYAFTQGRLP